MKPDASFADLDVPGYVELLDVRLREFNRPEEARKLAAMDLFDRTVMRWTPAEQWLGWFFDGLSPAAQIKFQSAVAELLARVRPGRFPLQALRELIGLVADVEAHVAVPAMVRLLADGGEWCRVAPGPLSSVIAVLKRLKPSGEAYGHLCRLVASPAFEDRLVFDAFELLVRARPDAWAGAWLLLRRKFDRALRSTSTADDDLNEEWFERRMRDLARRCLSALSPWTIAQGIDAIGQALGAQLVVQLDRYQPLGMLWHELVCLADSPFEKRGPAEVRGLPQERVDTASSSFEPLGVDETMDTWCRFCWRNQPHDDGVPWPENWVAWDVQWALLSQPWLSRQRLVCQEATVLEATGFLQALMQAVASQNQDLYRTVGVA